MSGWRSREVGSFRNAILGIAAAFRSERHMRFHVWAAAIVVVAAAWLRLAVADWLWVLAAIGSVWTAELFNTAIERAVDLATKDVHPLAKAAKDMASGAVLAASLFAAAIGCLVLGPPIWKALFE